MARTNDSIVYPEGKLFIARTLNGTGWEVRGELGVKVVKVPTDKGGQRTTYERTDTEGGVLEKGISKGIDARIAAVKLQVAMGMLTEEQGATKILVHKPAKK